MNKYTKLAWGIYMKSDIDKVVEAEREACAKLADKYKDIDYAASRCGPSWPNTANEVAAAIRARGNE